MKYDMESKNITVNVSIINGDIELSGEERNDIELDFDDLRKNTVDEIFDISFNDNVLEITQKDKKISKFMNIEEFPVIIKIPADAVVKGSVKNINGDIKIGNISGFEGQTGSKKGDISVSGITEADIDVNLISGDVDIREVNGTLKLSSISGDILMKECVISDLSAKSVSGDISIECEFNLTNDLVISSVTGDVDLNIVKFTGEAGITINSVSGDIDIKGEKPADEKIKVSQVKGEFSKFNKAFFTDSLKPMIKNLKDHIKDITQHKIKSEVHSSKKDNQNIQMILNMVSEGKISADEAEKLISALK